MCWCRENKHVDAKRVTGKGSATLESKGEWLLTYCLSGDQQGMILFLKQDLF